MLAQLYDAELADTGPRSPGGERMCVVTRAVRPTNEMIRFVAGPDGVLPDLKRRLPGRGVWVTGRRHLVAEAARRGAFKRGLRADVRIPDDLAQLTERLLVRSALDALAIAHKAGAATTGFAKVETIIRSNAPLAAVIHAAGASPDGVRKLAAALRYSGAESTKIAEIRSFSGDELDLALGRPNVVHAALLAGRASETFLARWHVLEEFRMDDPGVEGRHFVNAGRPPAAAPELDVE